jgi:hypothetical protein
MSFEFRDAKRADVSLLILLAGGTGSGKTESAMRLATGLAGGKPFAVIDTENGRALHKADDYTFQHAALDEPFTPERYAEAVKEADAAGFPVIVVDSGSHEYDGSGGVLDIQADEFTRMGERDSARMSSWIAPKRRHKAFVQQLLRVRAHVILCLRAEDKIEVVKQDGKTVVRPKQSLTGAEGWIPICEKRLPFEATISLLLTADAPGVPKPIKLERRHADLVPLDQPLTEETGKRLAEWARGGTAGQATPPGSSSEDALGGAAAPESPAEQSAFVPPEIARMTPEEFKAAREREGISPQQVGAKGRELFPGRSSGSLNDEERGQLWRALIERQEALTA